VRIFLIVLVPAITWSTTVVHAQVPPSTDAPPFVLRPVIGIADVGFDSNILAASANEQGDTTATPTLEIAPLWHKGRAQVAGNAALGVRYFRDHERQRSVDTDDSLRVNIRVGRAALSAAPSFLRVRDTWGGEVDVRALRTESALTSGLAVHMTGKSELSVAAARRYIRFGRDEFAEQSALADVLNRHIDTVSLSLQNDVTPLTRIGVTADLQRDQFDTLTSRDGQATHVAALFDLKPQALISGAASIGYRRFAPRAGGATPTVGKMVASVDLGYTLRNSTRWAVGFDRDVTHSVSILRPYYLGTGISGSVTQRFGSRWRVEAAIGSRWLTYLGTAVNPADEAPVGSFGPDTVRRYSLNASYRTNQLGEFGVTAEYYRRQSDIPGRAYDRLRLVSAFTSSFSRVPHGGDMPKVRAALAAATVAYATVTPAFAQAQQSDYIIGPRDVLTVTVWQQPDLSGRFNVEPDGSVTFPLVGRIAAGGLSVGRLEDTITRLLADGFVRDPQVRVAIEEYRSQSVNVIGEVRQPGTYPITGTTTLLQLIAKAGSTTERAGAVAVITRGDDRAGSGNAAAAQNRTVRANLKRLQTGILEEDVQLRGGDTVFIPRAESIYILGQVRTPGTYPLQEQTTVLEAIALAGGLTERGSFSRIRVRRDIDGKTQELKLTVDDELRPEDVLVVGERWF
jgi:polysaccharide export outer membrane protein